MKFKNLTEEQIGYFASVYKDKELPWDDRMKLLMDFIDKSERTVRKWAKL